MKKSILSLLAICAVASIQPNGIHDAVRDIHDELVPRHSPLLEKQRALSAELGLWPRELLLFTNKERDARRQSSEVKQLLHDFSVENAQVIGIIVCKKCLEKIPNPDVLDLGACYGKWLKSRDRAEQRDVAASFDTYWGYGDLCQKGLDEGDRLFRERILQMTKENFKEQNG